jgi:hypothetical protein
MNIVYVRLYGFSMNVNLNKSYLGYIFCLNYIGNNKLKLTSFNFLTLSVSNKVEYYVYL